MPVIGHRCDHLPAFFTRDSAFKLDHRLDEAADIAATMQAKWQLQLRGGVVVANPIPEQYAMPRDKIDAAIEQALGEAEAQGVAGKESTPSCWPASAS